MKKVLKLAIVSLLLFSFIIPYTAFAETDGSDTEWQNIGVSQEEFYSILANNMDNSISVYTTGLITGYVISCGNENGKLAVAGITRGRTDVVKCGFMDITIQRRRHGSSSWGDYTTLNDVFNDSFVCNLYESFVVGGLYEYRAYCTHYAKKNALSTEKKKSYSNVVRF